MAFNENKIYVTATSSIEEIHFDTTTNSNAYVTKYTFSPEASSVYTISMFLNAFNTTTNVEVYSATALGSFYRDNVPNAPVIIAAGVGFNSTIQHNSAPPLQYRLLVSGNVVEFQCDGNSTDVIRWIITMKIIKNVN